MGLSRGLKQWNHRWIELQDLESSGAEPGLMTYGPAVPWLNLSASRQPWQRWQRDVGPGWCLLADLAMGACTSTRPAIKTFLNISHRDCSEYHVSCLKHIQMNKYKNEGYRHIIHKYHDTSQYISLVELVAAYGITHYVPLHDFLAISAVRHLWAKTLTPDTTMCNAVITVSGLLRFCQISLDFWVTATVMLYQI